MRRGLRAAGRRLANLGDPRILVALAITAVTLWFALGLMTKPMLVTLPCVLLLLDYWPLNRLRFGQVGGDRNAQLSPSGVSAYQRPPLGTLILEKVPLGWSVRIGLSGTGIWLSHALNWTRPPGIT